MAASRMLPITFCILVFIFFFFFSSSSSILDSAADSNFVNLTLPHQHPYPDDVADDVQRRVNESLSRRLLQAGPTCQTGNPIDDCWRCDPNWLNNRQRLADCSIGFGRGALGGRGGQFYVVTDSSDHDPSSPTPGTLRYGVIQDVPLWIIFAADMTISLKHELIFNSYKTVDGRGAAVSITGNGCLTLQYVNHVIIHNVRIYDCKPSGNTNVASSPTHVGFRGRSDGDGISLFGAHNVWIDHCSLSSCTDGLIDAIMGSTGITISNNFFSRHNEVMLMGHDDRFVLDRGMQVTIAFNRFGEELVQRMPRCRHGYIHVVNNDFTYWKMYAIGGSASPTINSQGNRYVAPTDPDAKEVTKRVETDEKEWSRWNWRTDGDIMINGAFFVPSGAGVSAMYERATSLNAMAATFVGQITVNAGVLSATRNTGAMPSNPGINGGGAGGTTYTGSYGPPGSDGSGGGDVFGMIFGSGAAAAAPTSSVVLSLSVIVMILICITDKFIYIDLLFSSLVSVFLKSDLVLYPASLIGFAIGITNFK